MEDWKAGGMTSRIGRFVVRCEGLEGWWYDVKDWKVGGMMWRIGRLVV